jgi:glycosyltransferase involved in cell wall biosynthesis
VKKILIISYEFPPLIGGAGTYGYDLSAGLAELGHQLHIITYEHARVVQSDFKYYKKVSFSFVKNIPGFHFFIFFIVIMKNLRRYKYDHIVLSDSRAKKIVAFFYFFLKQYVPKTISVYHGGEIESLLNNNSKLFKFLNFKDKFIKVNKEQQLQITVSQKEYDKWKTRDFIDQSKLKLIFHGVNSNLFFKKDVDKKERIQLFTASRLVEKKGQMTIIDAIKKAKDAHVYFDLTIAGEGDFKESLVKRVKMHKLENQIRFIGNVSRNNLNEYYNQADVFLLISEFEEAFGLVYLEAAAAGIMSISGNRGGVRDAVLDNITGFTIKSKSADELAALLVKLNGDRKKVRALSDNAHQRFTKQFTHIIMCKNFIKTLSEKKIP